MRYPTRYAWALAIISTNVVGCDTPSTTVTFDNDYPATANALVVFRAQWQSVWFDQPIMPGRSADPQPALAASPSSAYVVLAPGWDPLGASPPSSFVVLLSRDGFDEHLDVDLHIPIDDAHFLGNCATGSHLAQDQADFITQQIFRADFAGLHYDAATCATMSD